MRTKTLIPVDARREPRATRISDGQWVLLTHRNVFTPGNALHEAITLVATTSERSNNHKTTLVQYALG